MPVSTTDANGIVTKYTYSDAGLVTRMERLDGSETLTSLVVSYDGAGRPVSYTDQMVFPSRSSAMRSARFSRRSSPTDLNVLIPMTRSDAARR